MSHPSYDEIRDQITRRYTRWTWFVFHVIMAVVTTAVIWMIDPTPQDGSPVIAALWSGVLFSHFVKLFIDERRDKAIESAWRQYAGDALEDEKPKRGMRLTDDAELEEIITEEPEAVPNRLSRHH